MKDMSWNLQEKRKKHLVVTLIPHPIITQSTTSLRGQDGSVFFFLSGVILFDNLQCLRGEKDCKDVRCPSFSSTERGWRSQVHDGRQLQAADSLPRRCPDLVRGLPEGPSHLWWVWCQVFSRTANGFILQTFFLYVYIKKIVLIPAVHKIFVP